MKRLKYILLCAVLILAVLALTGCTARIVDTPQLRAEPVSTPVPTASPEPTTEPEPEIPQETERIVFVEAGGEDTERKAVNVQFDANKGKCDRKSMKVYYSSYYGELPEASRSGYSFAGWYTEISGGVLVTENSVVSTDKDHTLYAHWTKAKKYKLTLDANGGRMKAGEETRAIYVGESYGGFPTPTRPGYELDGWFTLPDGGEIVDGNSVFRGNSDLKLYAHWTYDAYAFWSFTQKNIGERMYSCQQKSIYIEFEADDVTERYCTLISNTRSQNAAANREDMNVTDDWVVSKNPDVIIKCVGNMGDCTAFYNAVSSRFPGYRVLVVPSAAVYGSDAQRLYYELYLGKMLYPDWYDDVDIGTLGAELGVSGSIYG